MVKQDGFSHKHILARTHRHDRSGRMPAVARGNQYCVHVSPLSPGTGGCRCSGAILVAVLGIHGLLVVLALAFRNVAKPPRTARPVQPSSRADRCLPGRPSRSRPYDPLAGRHRPSRPSADDGIM